MPEELEPTGAEVTEDPTPAVEEGAEPNLVPDAPEAQPEPDAKADFHSLFKKAAEKAAAPEVEPEPEPKSDEGSEKPEDDPSEKADEEVPAEEAPESEEDAAKADTEGKRSRTQNFKEIKAENEQLVTERDTAVEKVEKLNAKLAEYGGLDVVQNALEIYDKLANGNAAEVIQNLPAHVRTGVQRQVFEAALGEEANRVLGVNTVLKTDFGLKTDLDQPTMEKIFEFAVTRLNADPDDFIAFIDRELTLAATPENELEKLRKEVDLLKSKPAEDGKEVKQSDPGVELTRIQTTHDTFETETLQGLIAPELKAYGLETSSKDTPAVKAAKEMVSQMIFEYTAHQMRSSKAFEPLLPYWLDNDVENSWYAQAAGNYKRAAGTRVEAAFKAVSKLLNVAKAPADAKPAAPSVPAPGEKRKAAMQPADKGKKPEGGFSSAWANARRASGS